jgi:hypothetical protein
MRPLHIFSSCDSLSARLRYRAGNFGVYRLHLIPSSGITFFTGRARGFHAPAAHSQLLRLVMRPLAISYWQLFICQCSTHAFSVRTIVERQRTIRHHLLMLLERIIGPLALGRWQLWRLHSVYINWQQTHALNIFNACVCCQLIYRHRPRFACARST